MRMSTIRNMVIRYIDDSTDCKVISKEYGKNPREYQKIVFEYRRKTYYILMLNYSYSEYKFDLYDIEREKYVSSIKFYKKYFNDMCIDTICDMVDSMTTYYEYI